GAARRAHEARRRAHRARMDGRRGGGRAAFRGWTRSAAPHSRPRHRPAPGGRSGCARGGQPARRPGAARYAARLYRGARSGDLGCAPPRGRVAGRGRPVVRRTTAAGAAARAAPRATPGRAGRVVSRGGHDRILVPSGGMARGAAAAAGARAGVRRGGARYRSPRLRLLRASGGDHACRRAGLRRAGRCRNGRALDARVPHPRAAGRTPAAALSAARRRAGGVRGGDLRSGHLDALRARPVTTFFLLPSANQLALTATVALAHGAGTPPGIAVAVPRISDAAVTIDGRLDEAIWAGAATLREFSQYVPNDNRPAEDSTTVLVWYSPTAIYFGIRAYQDSASVRATLADRDKITGDDYV